MLIKLELQYVKRFCIESRREFNPIFFSLPSDALHHCAHESEKKQNLMLIEQFVSGNIETVEN